MWTPRRIVLLALGYLMVFAGYLGYSLSVLGGIDGLPTLPLDLRATDSTIDPGPPPIRVRRVEERLRQAFGPEAPELKWPIQLELNNRTLVVAASDFKLEPDGRISLIRVAVAAYSRDRSPNSYPEINTLRGEVAYLKFDRPVSNLSEVSGRKIVGGEITGNIQVTSNRRTADRGDDLVLHIGTGPLYYAENKQLIWTHDTVHILDHQSKPRPMQIWGKGLEVELIAEATPAARPGPRRTSNDKISGVKRAQLHSNVDMTLYVDGSTGFPTGKRERVSPAASSDGVPRPQKAQVTIKTSGKFKYEFGKDFDIIRFEIPEVDPPQAERIQQFVIVERFHEVLAGQKEVRDQLYCARLELHLRKSGTSIPGEPKKPETGKGPSGERGSDILFARAQGPQVTMTSDSENLEANGTDLIYDARQSRTILRGEPRMTATKDRNRITGRELQITEHPPTAPGKKGYQTMVILGPGRFDLYDEKQTDRITAQAFWNERLSTSREAEYELLVLTGAARFVDRNNDQTLQGETLKVWSTTSDTLADSKTALAQPAAAGGRRVQVIEALGNVVTTSRDLNIHDTSRLIVRFRDAPEGQLPVLPPALPGKPPAGEQMLPPAESVPGPVRGITPPPVISPRRDSALKPVLLQQPSNPGTPNPPSGGGQNPGLIVGGTNQGPRKPNEPARPLLMSARNIEAWIVRTGQKNHLERVWTEGSVHVKQAPAKPEEKGLDILGDTLAMDCHAEGNVLEVTGDLAQLRMDRLYILGPVVNIDQTRNMAWVNGTGAMQMESQTNFAGDKLKRPVPMIIQWRKSMVFNGSHAEFHQSIQAEQENALLVCDTLQVFFDRHIELKQGTRSDQPARVKTLVCDRNVRVEERVAQGERILKYQRIETAETLRLDALEAENGDVRSEVKPADGNEIRAGAGTLRLFQIGGPDPLAQPGKPGTVKKEPEPKLTYIHYGKSLYVNSKLNKAVFYGQVRVINLPSKDPLAEVKIEELLADLPAEALYLACDRMTVLDRGDKARSQQEMLAQGRVTVKAREFWGQADTVSFNEAKDQIILDGGPDGEATLYKEVGRGVPPQKITGKKITYIRSTGDFKLDEGRGILGQ